MPRIIHPRSVTMLPIANVAIPSILILLVVLAGGLITGGLLFGLVYLFRRYSGGSAGLTGR
ncbi:hypothetical protein AB7C87_22915 [Natrarchaeobius sp. A-rgal3]|uniref:hypothetical protein n=1 Tax=Natrarchaeobius versutus TaxID=1679078 RepID=UPI0035108B50